MALAREGFKKVTWERIDSEAESLGKTFLSDRWKWVFECPVAENVRQGMTRMAFILGRPTHMSFAHTTVDQRVTRGERDSLTTCVTELWLQTLRYMKNLWSLRRSIVAAPHPVQDRLRTCPATAADLRGMLERPYYQRERRMRNKKLRSTLARFCTLRSQPPPGQSRAAECLRDDALNVVVEPVDNGDDRDAQAVGIQTWIQWLRTAGDRQLNAASSPLLEGGSEGVEPEVADSDTIQDDSHAGVAQLRRNPSRVSRPPEDIDLGEWGYFITPQPACGRIATGDVDRIKRAAGPELRRHPDDYERLWCRQSEWCPGALL